MYWTRHIPRNQRLGPQKGAPDLLVYHPSEGRNCQIEVKVQRPDSTSWAMAELDIEQRRYLDNIVAEGGDAYLAFGVIRYLGGQNKDKKKKRSKIEHGYIVPWLFWKRIEEYYASMLQVSIPYDWGYYQRKPEHWGRFADLKSLLEESHECPLIETKIVKTENFPALPERCRIRINNSDVPPFHVRRKEEDGFKKPIENRFSVIT